MKWIVIFLSFLLSGIISAQTGINDTISVNQSPTYFNNLISSDSGYFCAGMVTDQSMVGNPGKFLLGHYSNEGQWNELLVHDDPGQDQRSAFSINQLITNNQGNLVHVYNNCGSGNCYPRLIEVSPQGILVKDTIFSSVIDSFGLQTFASCNIYHNEVPNSYTLLVNTTDTAKFNQGSEDFSNVLYLRVNEDFTITDTLLFADPLQQRSYVYASRCLRDNGDEIIMILDQRQAGLPENEFGRMVFYKINSSGTTEYLGVYEPNQNNIAAHSLLYTKDGNYVFTYITSEFVGNDWLYSNRIAKLDTALNVIWDIPSREENFPTPIDEVVQHRIIEGVDSSLITTSFVSSNDSDSLGIELQKINQNGDFIWKNKLPKVIVDEENISYSSVVIQDIIPNYKAGYTMTGYMLETTFGLSTKAYGYIVETNCLGFVSTPEAHFNYARKDNFEVEFYNTSMQAGSYVWHFGNGDSLLTDTSQDTVTYNFGEYGPNEITLVARGCENEADTVSISINPSLIGDPATITDGQGYFMLFPNPTIAGKSVHIYLNEIDVKTGDVWLRFYSEDGKLAEEVQLTAKEGAYILNVDLASGVYSVNLVQGGILLQSRKIVIL